jgi:hypothetical protein
MNRVGRQRNSLMVFFVYPKAWCSRRYQTRKHRVKFAYRKKSLLILEIGVYLLGHGPDRHVAHELLSVDEEGGRGVGPKLLGRAVALRIQVFERVPDSRGTGRTTGQ